MYLFTKHKAHMCKCKCLFALSTSQSEQYHTASKAANCNMCFPAQSVCCDHCRCSRADMCCFTSPGSASEQARTAPLTTVLVLVDGSIYNIL